MTGLASDPARQAHDTVRGFVYQILRSILVWLELDDEEQLFLEGAEDLDRIGDTEALTEQVKDTAGSGNVSLRSASVTEAINNFWAHRLRNPEVTIRFNYVTTSGITVEQGAPFGKACGGLDLWNSLRVAEPSAHRDEQVGLIVRFLLAEGRLSAPLQQLFRTANASEIHRLVIAPIEWLAGQLDGDALIRKIKDRLVIRGKADGLAPAEAELAFDALYTAAFEAAKQRDEIPLTRAQFLRIFAGATGIHVSKQDLRALMQAALSGSSGGFAINAPPLIFEGPPPLPQQYFRREEAEKALDAALLDGPVLLHGSTGSGKTLSAASTFAGREPLWLSLRDLKPAEVKARLLAAVGLIHAAGVAKILVIDDLDGLSDPRVIEGPLGAMWNRLRGLGGQLVITSDRPLPERLAQAVQLDAGRELQMQPFNADEIDAFLRQNGCPEDKVKLWAKMLEVSTNGHPQLINARVRTLSAEQFPDPNSADFLGTADDVDRIRFEARRLIAELPDGARELLLRSSLITGRLTRQRLMAIGSLPDAIAEPGTAIDIIAGPWLEATDERDFRVSPLARGAADQLRGQEWSKAMHGQLAWIYLRDRTVTPWDISSILMHCYIAGSAGPIAYVSQGMFSAADETWAAVGESCGIYASLGLDASNPLPFRKPADVFVFRIFQYRIAAEIDANKAMRIAAKIEEEFADAPDDEQRLFFRFLYLSQLLSVEKVSYPIKLLIARALEFYDTARVLEETLPDRMARAGIERDDEPAAGTYVQVAAIRILTHIKDIDDFLLFLEALKDRTADDAKALLNAMGDSYELSSYSIERLWLAQHSAKEAGWAAFCEKLRGAFKFCADIGALSVARAIAPVLIRTINEDIGDAAQAIVQAEQFGTIVQDDPVYLCALAKAKSDAGQYPKAKVIWRDALPRWPQVEDDIGGPYAYRAAAIAAGKNNEWKEAAAYFEQARAIAANGSRPTLTLGLAADSALATFLAGERAESVVAFDAIVTELEPMQSEHEREPLLSLQRRMGGQFHAISGWIKEERTLEDLCRLVGICSSIEPQPTQSTVAPPLDTLRMDLISIDLAYGTSLDCALRQAPKLRSTPILSLRATNGMLLFALAQRTLDFSDVVSDGLAELDARSMLTEHMATIDRDVLRHFDGQVRTWPPTLDEVLMGNLLAAVFGLAATNQLDRLPIARWRADAAAHPQGGRVLQLVDHLEGLFVTGTVDAWATVLKSQTADWPHHAASALAATMLERLAPDALLVAQSLWVHYLKQPHLTTLVEHYVEYLVTQQWRRILMLAPGSFGLDPQALTSFNEAVTDHSNGWPKVRRILQTALSIINLDAGDQCRVTIEAMED